MPTVNVGEPVKRILLVELPAASPLPAANSNAGDPAVLDVLVVATFLETVKLPVVLILIAPLALMPS